MKKNVIRIISLVGIISSLSMLLACSPAGKALMMHGATIAVSRGIENAVDDNYTHSANCPHCGSNISWQGKARLVRCGSCQNKFAVNP